MFPVQIVGTGENKEQAMKRRDFLKNTARTTAAALGLVECFPAGLAGMERVQSEGQLERRPLGKTGEKLSIIGFSGFALNKQTFKTARRLVAEAIDRGVNYFDVAPQYGTAEELLGPPLEPHRKNIFLACKTEKRRKKEAAASLENSLKVLRTDHFDLFQFHYVTTLDDVETIFGPGGAMEAFEEAKKAGKIRFIGFSAHSVEAAMAMLDRHDFDSILFPVNYATWNAGDFGPQVLAKAQEKGMGIAGIKAMAKGPWPSREERKKYPGCWYEPFSDPKEALMGLRFTLSHPVTTAFPPADKRLLRMGWELGRKFTPLEPGEAEEIKGMGLKAKPIFKYPRS